MADKFKKIDKEYLVTDSTVNCYGFRLLTDGYDLPEYEKNPIGYYMHLRDDGVVVRWEDFRVEGDKVFAKPVINLSNARGQQTVDEIESGFLNAASVGHYVIAELSDDPALKLPGQTGPTVTKWYNRELSLVDIPGNYNALTDLYDTGGNKIQNLADFKKNSIQIMKPILFTAEQISALNLKADNVEPSSVESAFNDLVAKAAKVDGLESQIGALKSDKTDLENQLSSEKKKNIEKEVSDLLEKGLADKKITVKVQTQLAADYKENPVGLKSLLDGMSPIHSITDTIIGNEGQAGRLKELASKSWDQLDRSGELPELKSLDLELFKQKYKQTFKEDYK